MNAKKKLLKTAYIYLLPVILQRRLSREVARVVDNLQLPKNIPRW
jgi:hypothetical protein